MSDKVLVAMSGGVDSSVTLLQVIEMGYEAVGVTMKLWEYEDMGGKVNRESSCCAIESIHNAKLVCADLGVPHYTIDFTKVFRKEVVDNFADEYLAGRTPNPCVRCNSFLKWDALIEKAGQIGADFIATGHYAQIEKTDTGYQLKRGVDLKKDQSYVLWGIPLETLGKTILPLGRLTKPEVRELARKHDLGTAETPESMEICFIPDNNYSRFLSEYRSDEIDKIGKGNIIENDELVGTHPGYINYTIGQRKGLRLSNPEPRYVKEIHPDDNTVVVGTKERLGSSGCSISQVNWLVDIPHFPVEASTMIRYNSQQVPTLLNMTKGRLTAQFNEPQLSVTPGQSIVFYQQDTVLGGGIID